MNRYHYQIILKPLSKYFFGGERYYDEKDSVFYFERSQEYPQQTTLLGMLRYQLLIESGSMELSPAGPKLKSASLDAAKILIGENSFDPLKTFSFGQIKKLSPIVLIDQDKRLWLSYPKAKTASGLEELDLEIMAGGKTHFGLEIQEGIPSFSNFNHKLGLEQVLINGHFSSFQKHAEVFCEPVAEEEQIGMYKAYRKKGRVEETEDRGFYKYQYCQLKKEFAFTCFLETSDPIPLQSTIIRMGKERTPFEMTVLEAQNPFQNPTISPGDRILLVSDAYLDGNWSQCCQAAVVDLKPFRNLVSGLDPKKNYDQEPNKSPRRLNLMKRGSLLWVSKDAARARELQKLFDDQAPFQTIGYNHFMIQNPTTI